MNTNQELFEKACVPKAVAAMAIPTMISMLVAVVYNMADTFFIGQTDDPLKVAAVSLTSPIFLFMMALGNLFGIGGSSAISRALGDKNTERARHLSSFCCYASLGIGVITALVLAVCMTPLLNLLGASAATMALSKEYLVYITFGAPFILFATACGNLLRGEGASKESMIGNMIGTVVNIVLDPVIILWFGRGVAGAAVATVLGNMAASGYYLWYFLRKSSLSIRLRDFQIKQRIAANVMSIGIPASVNTFLISLSNILLNQALSVYGDAPIAAMGVAIKCNLLVSLLLLGLCTGVQPLIGYSYGSGNRHRLLQIFRFTAGCSIVLGTLLTIFLIVFRNALIQGFIDDASISAYGNQMLIALQISGPLLGLFFLSINTLQGMGKAFPSLILALCRQGLVFIPMLYFLKHYWGLDGIIYTQPVADYASIFIGLILCTIMFRTFQGNE